MEENEVVLSFPDLKLTQSLDVVLHDLRELMASSLKQLEKEVDEDDVMLEQFRGGLQSSEGI